MLAKRIIPCLDIKGKEVVKGVEFENLVSSGDPVELAKRYYAEGPDELVLLDIAATAEERKTLIELVEQVAKAVFIPFTVGGGISSVGDMRALLRAGADKVAITTAAVENPRLISEASAIFGSQCIVVGIDAKKEGGRWKVFTRSGKKRTELDVAQWAKEVQRLGAGEILLTSIDKDGTKSGYDLALTKKVSEAVSIPVIASGGAKGPETIFQALTEGKADAALAASIFHTCEYSVKDVKVYLAKRKIEVRL